MHNGKMLRHAHTQRLKIDMDTLFVCSSYWSTQWSRRANQQASIGRQRSNLAMDGLSTSGNLATRH
eukprot:881920-Pleurochrysis_carterae.AAC.1